MSPIYTKRGDRGTTSLRMGKEISKGSLRVEALGAIDECNSALGCALAFLSQEKRAIPSLQKLVEELTKTQQTLLSVGALLAHPFPFQEEWNKSHTKELERWIDALEKDLPKLTNFLLPGGTPASAFLHLARAICRRAEQKTVLLFLQKEAPEELLSYLNRLSDYLFVAARGSQILSKGELSGEEEPSKLPR